MAVPVALPSSSEKLNRVPPESVLRYEHASGCINTSATRSCRIRAENTAGLHAACWGRCPPSSCCRWLDRRTRFPRAFRIPPILGRIPDGRWSNCPSPAMKAARPNKRIIERILGCDGKLLLHRDRHVDRGRIGGPVIRKNAENALIGWRRRRFRLAGLLRRILCGTRRFLALGRKASCKDERGQY